MTPPPVTRRRSSRRAVLAAAVSVAVVVSQLVAPGVAQAATTMPTATVVTLGDSYASGEGNPAFTANAFGNSDADGCHRSDRGGHAQFARWVLENEPGTYLHAACSGGTVTDVLVGAKGEPSQLQALGPNTRVVTLSAGGNDVGFSPILMACGVDGLGNAGRRCADELLAANQRLIAMTSPSAALGGVSPLEHLYRSVLARAPNAQLLVVGYPMLFPAKWNGNCSLFLDGSTDVINQLTVKGNTLIRQTARRAGATYVDIAGVFDGHSSCEKKLSKNWIHYCVDFKQDGETCSVYSFHPKGDGQDAIAGRLWKEYRDLPMPKLRVTSATLTAAALNTAYRVPLGASGGRGPLRWRLQSGTLPAGVTLSADGILAGTPTASGSFPFSVRVTDTRGNTATAQLTLLVKVPTNLRIEATSVPDGMVGIAYTLTFTASGAPGPYTWSVPNGALPEGLTLAPTGTLAGTPTKTGTSSFTVQVTDRAGGAHQLQYTLRVNGELPPPVTAEPPPPSAPPFVCGAACATSWGDPHLVTFDGAAYDLQSVGEFVALRSTADDLEVQVRQQPWNGSRVVSVNTAAAMRVAGHRVTVTLTEDGVVTRLDGATITPAKTGTALPAGGTIAADPGTARTTVRWPDGSAVVVDASGGTYLTLSVSLSAVRLGAVRGLLGDADGAAGNDAPAAASELHGPFANSWRITQAGSLFDYATGQSTATFTDTAFPYGSVAQDNLPPAHRTAAETTCRKAGVTDPQLLSACVLDVAVSGDATLAVGAGNAQRLVADADIVAASAAGDSWTDATGGTGAAVPTFGHLGCTAIDGASACTAGTWPTMPGAVAIWTDRLSVQGRDIATFTRTVTVSETQASRTLTLSAWADDRFVVFLNGTEIGSGDIGRITTIDVKLKPGANVLKFTVSNNSGWDPNGNPGGLLWKLADKP